MILLVIAHLDLIFIGNRGLIARTYWVPARNCAKTYGKAPYNGRDFPDNALFRESVYLQEQTGVLLRFERIQQWHYGMKLMAYTLINLRGFCVT